MKPEPPSLPFLDAPAPKQPKAQPSPAPSMDDMLRRGEPADAVPSYPPPRAANVRACAHEGCQAGAYMGFADRPERYCAEHMEGILEEYREELKRAVKS